MSDTRGNLSILACESGNHFANKVLEKLKQKGVKVNFIDSKEHHFADTEIKTVIEKSIRGADIYIFQDVENSVNGYSVDENLRALKTAIDAAWRCDASYITAVIPVFPYVRQDKQVRREGITASMVAREIEDANADHVITLDVHNLAIEGYFRRAKFENLRAYKTLVDYIKEHPDDFDPENLRVMAPDLGGAERAGHYAQQLGVEPVFSYKKKNDHLVESIQIIGEVEDKDVLIVDDMIDTAGTIIEAVRASKDAGAQKVYAVCSLPLFNEPALERITKAYDDGCLTAVVGTDAVYHGVDFQEKNPWFIEVSVASYFAKVISSMNKRDSISALLG